MYVFHWFWIILLLPLPLVMRFIFRPYKNNKDETSPRLVFPNTKFLSSAFANNVMVSNNKRFNWFLLLLSIFWALLILALMRPQKVDVFSEKITNKGYDIMLTVDISKSMEIADFVYENKQIKRLEIVKKVINDFTKQRAGDRLGLILFGQYAYLQTPMTTDLISVSNMLNNAAAGMAGDITAIGDSMILAINEVKNKEKSKIVILLTDGADNASNISPEDATKIAKHYGIKFYTIGIISPYDHVNIQSGSVNEGLLEKIAADTGGQYFRVDSLDGLKSAYDKINELEKIDIETQDYKIYYPLYRYPLGMACIVFLLICVFPLLQRLI